MKQMCKKKYPSPCSCCNKLSNPCCLTVSAEPRLQTTVRQLGLESSIWQEWGLWIIIIIPGMERHTHIQKLCSSCLKQQKMHYILYFFPLLLYPKQLVRPIAGNIKLNRA